MALKVIGAGFGRTGTESLKSALELTGFGPCDHMHQLIKSTWRVPHLEALHRGEHVDIEGLFQGYQSAVDFPFAMYYRKLADHYPEAKVILTVRDGQAWYESARKTIFREVPGIAIHLARGLGVLSRNAAGFPRWANYVRWAIREDFFEGRTSDREFMIARFERWNQEVQDAIPPSRLLVYEVTQGWKPLCDFLEVDVPPCQFPRSNDSDSFQKRTRLRNILKTIK